MSFYVAIIVVLSITALGVLACLAVAWVLAGGKSWQDDSETCPHCGQLLESTGDCPRCGSK